MGKSKRVKMGDVNLLRNMVKRRKAAKVWTWISAVVFFLSCIFIGALLPNMQWLIFVFLLFYIMCFFYLRQASRCPYCGYTIMSKYNSTQYCPKCHRPIKPEAGKNK